MNSGLFYSAQIKKKGFQLYAGLVTMTALISNDQKTFTAKTEEMFYPPATTKAPTIFSSTEGAAVEGTGGTAYVFPGGFSMNALPVAVPQISIGSFMGTEASFRFIDIELDENLGSLNLTGFGIRHSFLWKLP